MGGQRVDLVLHQRDEGGDDQRRTSFIQQCRKLVAKGFAAAGRQNSQHVLAAQRAGKGLQLAWQEGLKAKELPGGLSDVCLFTPGNGNLVVGR